MGVLVAMLKKIRFVYKEVMFVVELGWKKIAKYKRTKFANNKTGTKDRRNEDEE